METTREAAFAKGDAKFYNAKPCKRGHVAPRYVTNGGCTLCQNHQKFRTPADRKRAYLMGGEPYAPRLILRRAIPLECVAEFEAALQLCLDSLMETLPPPAPYVPRDPPPPGESYES